MADEEQKQPPEEPQKQEEVVEEPQADVEETVPEEEKEVVAVSAKELSEEAVAVAKPEKEEAIDTWSPKTSLGKQVKTGEISDIDQILDNGMKLLEAEIVDRLMPDLESDLLLIGQSKGKFGGGQRRVFKQTQKKTREGNKPKFATYAIVGNKDGYVGVGYGKSKETVPAREKAFRNAKLNIRKIRRGIWGNEKAQPHTIPFAVEGKCGSAKIRLIPAPKGTGLKVEKEVSKILAIAGIEDVWSQTRGQTKTKINLIKACEDALKKLMEARVSDKAREQLKIKEGKLTSGETA